MGDVLIDFLVLGTGVKFVNARPMSGGDRFRGACSQSGCLHKHSIAATRLSFPRGGGGDKISSNLSIVDWRPLPSADLVGLSLDTVVDSKVFTASRLQDILQKNWHQSNCLLWKMAPSSSSSRWPLIQLTALICLMLPTLACCLDGNGTEGKSSETA